MRSLQSFSHIKMLIFDHRKFQSRSGRYVSVVMSAFLLKACWCLHRVPENTRRFPSLLYYLRSHLLRRIAVIFGRPGPHSQQGAWLDQDPRRHCCLQRRLSTTRRYRFIDPHVPVQKPPNDAQMPVLAESMIEASVHSFEGVHMTTSNIQIFCKLWMMQVRSQSTMRISMANGYC